MSILSSNGAGMTHFANSIGNWLKKYAVLDFGSFKSPGNGSVTWPLTWTDGKKWIKITFQSKEGVFIIDADGIDFLFANYPFSSLNEGLNDLGNYTIKFGKITGGSFICSHSKLSSLEGFPDEVGRIYDISYSEIRDISCGLPKLVDIDYVCNGCCLTKQEIESKTKVTCNIHC